MKRRVLAVTGSRAEYGAMRPVFRAIVAHDRLELDLLVTAMHLQPAYAASLEEIRRDAYGSHHFVNMSPGADSGKAMAEALGIGISGIAGVLERVAPDMVLLQGDRGEMLAAAIAAAHMNVPIVHMSGGDLTGTIDQPVRNAITQFAQLHLTTCADSSERLRRHGEDAARIIEVGEPGIDAILGQDYAGREDLARQLGLNLAQPVVIATLHPVTTETAHAGRQMRALLDALESLGLQTVFTYPNSDAGGQQMRQVLEARRGAAWLRIAPHLGSRNYLGLMRVAAVMAGNSSSGILEAPSFQLPVVNVGTRQHGRTRSANVIDVGDSTEEIVRGIRAALDDAPFRARVRDCTNPYGDGRAGERTAHALAKLRLSPALISKWIGGAAVVD